MIVVSLAIVFFSLAGVAEAVMDILQFKFMESVFKNKNQMFWNPQLSWQNKWKDGCPKFGPKFFGSTTVFVFVTDAWHLFKWVRNRFNDLGIAFLIWQMSGSFYIGVAFALLCGVLRSLVFEHSFRKLQE